MSSNRTEHLQLARTILKKILAAGGSEQDGSRLQGNFYYCFKGENHALVVTLTRRDPKGKRVLTEGKLLRREMKAGKFLRGTVEWSDGKRPMFTIHAGNATKVHLRNALRKKLATEEGLKLSFLKKCIVTEPDDVGIDAEDDLSTVEGIDEAAIEQDLELDPAEAADLSLVLREQDRLGSLNVDLDEFLSDRDAEQERDEIVLSARRHIAKLEAIDPVDREAIADLEAMIAEASHRGSGPLPRLGEILHDAVAMFLKASRRRVTQALAAQLEQIDAKVRAKAQEADELDGSQLAREARSRIGELRSFQAHADWLRRALDATGDDIAEELSLAAAIDRRADAAIAMLQQDPTGSFQLFVRGLGDKTITLNGCTSDMDFADIIGKLEDKTNSGLAFADARLTFASKELTNHNSLEAVGATKESTLEFLVRGRGGFGEWEAVSSTKDMKRGNVRQTIKQTRGESRVLMGWVRGQWGLSREMGGIAAQHGVNPRDPEIALQISALVQMTAGAGNCGEYSEAVAAALVGQEPDPPGAMQYVYQVYMYPNSRDVSEDSGYKTFDHALCVTYPEKISQKYVSKFPELDKATIADGWDNNMVLTAESFLGGRNAYGAKLRGEKKGDLKVFAGPFECSGKGLPKAARQEIVATIRERLDDFKSRPGFKQRCREAEKDDQLVFDFPVAHDVQDFRTARQIMDKIKAVQNESSFPAEVLELADAKIYDLIQGDTQIKDKMFTFDSICRRIWGILLALNNRELTRVTATHMSDEQFILFYKSGSAAADRLRSHGPTQARVEVLIDGDGPEPVDDDDDDDAQPKPPGKKSIWKKIGRFFTRCFGRE